MWMGLLHKEIMVRSMRENFIFSSIIVSLECWFSSALVFVLCPWTISQNLNKFALLPVLYTCILALWGRAWLNVLSWQMYIFIVYYILSVCGTNCHRKCKEKMANLCGVDKLLLANALELVRSSSGGSSMDQGVNNQVIHLSNVKLQMYMQWGMYHQIVCGMQYTIYVNHDTSSAVTMS